LFGVLAKGKCLHRTGEDTDGAGGVKGVTFDGVGEGRNINIKKSGRETGATLGFPYIRIYTIRIYWLP